VDHPPAQRPWAEIPRQILNELTPEAGGWLLVLVHPRVVGREISCPIFAQDLEDLPRLILFALELLDGGPAGAALGQADKGTEVVARAEAGIARQLAELLLFCVAELDVLRLPRQCPW